MGKKKFIDKKKSATFHLLSRDSSDPNYDQGPGGDRVFVRVDNNPYPVDVFDDGEEHSDAEHETNFVDDSIFADADEDDDEDLEIPRMQFRNPSTKSPLPDEVRKEILELGFPDDGYNYLTHLREIKKTSSFYENSKAKVEQFQLPLDVKAYDASKIRIPEAIAVDVDEKENEKLMYSVAAKTVSVRVERAVDRDVVELLEDDDCLSRFGSDVEDLEEDFVVMANQLGEGEEEEEDVRDDREVDMGGPSKMSKRKECYQDLEGDLSDDDELRYDRHEVEQRPRVRRELDEQFDMLALKEYDTESDSEYGSGAEDDVLLADRLNNVHIVKELALTESTFNEAKYKVPTKKDGSNDADLDDPAPDVIRRCAEYAEKYNAADDSNDEVVIEEDSSDESEKWDCETIVTTYSNLDNHPGKIWVPENTRKKKPAKMVSALPSVGTHVISLRGKEKLPVDFLPHGRKLLVEKGNKENDMDLNKQRRRPHEESKEEKKERKAAVKEERREARKAKKELKGLYKCEAQRAQKVAAVAAPSSIRLM